MKILRIREEFEEKSNIGHIASEEDPNLGRLLSCRKRKEKRK
jgi:hypothetical protein